MFKRYFATEYFVGKKKKKEVGIDNTNATGV